MITVDPVCSDGFGFALGNSSDPGVVIIPIKAYAQMQAASYHAFGDAAVLYAGAGLVIGLIIGVVLMHFKHKIDEQREVA